MKNAITCLVMSALMWAASADAQILTGSIIGTVRDESAAVLPGATVTLSSTALPGGPMTVTTNERGEYRFTGLAPGGYSLNVSLPGFSAYQEEALRVAVGGTTERTVTLKVAAVGEVITVSGESPMVDTRKVGVTANLDVEAVETLPRNRNALHELVKWSPGVAPNDPSGGGGGSVMGAARGENSFMWDGIMTNHPSTGNNWSSGDVDAAEEVQILTLGASAEYQVAQGAVFNIVFKQGTNDWKGDASAFWYPDSLLSKPIKLPCNCDLGETGATNLVFHNYSAHVGGPIRKDRLWFYGGGNYDRRKQGLPGTDARLIPKLWYSDALFGKVTWQVSDRVKYSGTYHHDVYGSQSRPSVATPFETINASDAPWLISYANEVNYTIGTSTLLTTRITGWTDRVNSYPYTGDRTASYHFDQSTGRACCGVQSFGKTRLGRHGQAVKLSRYVQGAGTSHDFRVGVQLEQAYAQDFNTYPSGVQYLDLNGNPDQANFRSPYVQGAEYASQGVWAEDQMNIRGRLTVSLGMRYDRMHATSPDLPRIDNLVEETGETVNGLGDMFTWSVFAPRLGVNYKLTEDAKTIARAHYGRAYRTIFLGDFNLVHPGLSPITLARYSPATGGYSTIVSVTDPIANLAVDPDLDAPYTDSYSIGFDRELVANLAVGTTFVYKRGENQIGWEDVGGVYGERVERLPDGRTLAVFPLLNAPRERRFLRTNGPGAFSRYKGLILGLDKRYSQRWRASISYTYSRSEGLPTTGQDPNDNINAAGRTELDRPHMVIVSGSYEVPKIELEVSTSYMGISGTPYAPQALVQLPQGRRTINVDVPGSHRLPAAHLLDVRFTKVLFRQSHRRIELSAELANALQETSPTAVLSRNLFSTTFGQASAWPDPRRLNFVARAAF